MVRERSFNSYLLKIAFILITVFLVLIALLALVQPAQAQTYTVLHSFGAVADGRNPYGGVVLDQAGNLYGTTMWGGCCIPGGVPLRGTVFKLDQAGNERVLHTFAGRDGAYPQASLVRDAAGNLYGTTPSGGITCVVYGTCGVVFKLDPTGNETVLHAFTGAADGSRPLGGLILDAAGNLYGTTQDGGAVNGVAFKLDPAGNETVLHNFAWPEGYVPVGDLIRDAAGNLYGTTYFGGDFNNYCQPNGCGIVFKLDPAGNETVLHAFNGTDGNHPLGGLARDPAGNLYGTTEKGGVLCPGFGYCGVAFKLDPAGNETVLYAFTGGADGASPNGGVVLDAAGNLYGTTFAGGSGYNGVLFKLDQAGHYSVLHAFGLDGAFPYAGLVEDAAGNLYGTTSLAGAYGYGVVFKITFH